MTLPPSAGRMVEFTARSLTDHGKSHCYRRSHTTVKIRGDKTFNEGEEEIEVPEYLEMLSPSEDWIRHPVVYLHRADPNASDHLVVFTARGNRYITPHTVHHGADHALYRDAQQKGLTKGILNGVIKF